ncbi:MAG: hypothetical protein ACLGH0_09745 [Thermoanaerobaculia bacterium]
MQEKRPARLMHQRDAMDEQKLIEALIARADEDAQTFRKQHPDDVPSDRWIENSFTAALPLAKDDAGIDPGPGPHPQLFDAYRREIASLLGEREAHRDRGDELVQQPTPGEH